MSGGGEPGEVITIGLTSSDTDETHLRMALAYGAAQQAKVRLVVQRGYSPQLLDTVIERHLDHVGRTLRVLPPLIEVQWAQRLPASAESEP